MIGKNLHKLYGKNRMSHKLNIENVLLFVKCYLHTVGKKRV